MKKLVIFTCLLIPHLLIGQSKSLVITNKKNGKELIIKIGEIIKVKGKNSIYKERGKFTAFSDSILNNYPFSLETVNSIYYKNKTNKLMRPLGFVVSGVGAFFFGTGLVLATTPAVWILDFRPLGLMVCTIAGVTTYIGSLLLIKRYSKSNFEFSIR